MKGAVAVLLVSLVSQRKFPTITPCTVAFTRVSIVPCTSPEVSFRGGGEESGVHTLVFALNNNGNNEPKTSDND